MQYRQLGKTGIRISEIGFGAWALGGQWGGQDDRESVAALHRALDCGVNFIDTAEGYGDGRSERVIAEALRTRSEKVFVATKTPPAAGPWPPSPYCHHRDRYSADYLRRNVEDRLKQLGVDCIDLLQLHTWTSAWNHDPQPLIDLQKLRNEGKIRWIGISTPEQDQSCVVDLMRAGLVDTIQIIYNIFEQQPAAQILPVAAETGTGVIVRCVFDEGVLTGKYPAEHQFPESDFRHRYFMGDRMARSVKRVEAIQADIRQLGLEVQYSMADVAALFALNHSAVSTVITGIRTVAQAEKNAAVSDKAPLSTEMMNRLRQHLWLRGVWYGGK
jgi:aryl-alcohol dehydrogenase-like predicted oxidoreductase